MLLIIISIPIDTKSILVTVEPNTHLVNLQMCYEHMMVFGILAI